MAEELKISEGADKTQTYEEILPQIKALIDGETNLVANLSNIAAVLDTAFQHLWTGFYLKDPEKPQLVLGPFQGPVACTRIPLEPVARGVCGAAAKSQQTQLVPDVEKFPGHIACSSASKSEIVVPLVVDGETKLVLDIDSCDFNTFDETDQKYCEQIIAILKEQHF